MFLIIRYKKLQIVFIKILSAHDRAHDLYALMSGAIFDPLMSGFLMIALTEKSP
jgi:hypothetical protein